MSSLLLWIQMSKVDLTNYLSRLTNALKSTKEHLRTNFLFHSDSKNGLYNESSFADHFSYQIQMVILKPKFNYSSKMVIEHKKKQIYRIL